MAQWQKIDCNELSVGQPLLWPVYDKQGTLLLSAGQKFSSEMTLVQLLDRGAYRLPNQKELNAYREERDKVKYPSGTNPFQLFTEFSQRLKNIFISIEEKRSDTETRLLKLARDIQKFCQYDVNAALAVVHLPLEGCYTLSHPLHCTIVGELIAQGVNLASDEQEILCGANLVANISMGALQKVLNKQTEPVSDLQFKEIKQHPEKTVELLYGVGVKNPLLLEIILQHHERLDGSGYPFGLRGDEIIQSARILGVADTYAAMASDRVHSKPLAIKEVLKELFLQRNKLFDDEASLVLIKTLGIYPVGSFVRLKNGDTAIVIEQDKENSLCPKVKSIMDINKRGYGQPFKRDTKDTKFSIEASCRYENADKLNLSLLWDYV